jgi:hypothetical protein
LKRIFTLFAAVVTGLACWSCGGSSGGGTPPPPTTYTIGGTVTGLSGTGLVLQDNGGDSLTIAVGATTFTFATKIASGGAYKVTVLTQPSSPAQTCAVSTGSGTGTATANVTTVQVACTTTTYTIGGTLSGLSGTVVLQNNGSDNLSLTANGTFTFTTSAASGEAYKVAVLTQPTGQTCAVTAGSGTATANVTTVQVACTTTTYTIGGTVSGLSGAGLVLQDNSSGNLPIAANGAFAFTTKVASGVTYNVTVFTQPSNPSQTCLVTSGGGVALANVTSVQVNCTTSPTFTVGGTVSGLAGAGLVLQNNGGNNLTVTANGTFTFAAPVASGGAYDVTILIQPSSPAQTCTVTNGSGVAVANVTNVQVICAADEWTWVNGPDSSGQIGTYGTIGTSAPGNVPGGTDTSVSWTDAAGNFWLFGGRGLDSAGTTGVLNSLWEYSAGEWTWIGGSSLANQSGTYGTQGTAAPGNIPGARWGAAHWSDAGGNLWMFGGNGFDSAGTSGELNDLWEYSAGEWTWVGGSNIANQSGTYGTLGTAAPANVPGGRDSAAFWVDVSGNFWLLGGSGFDSVGSGGELNDLWEYSGGEWAWIGGADLFGTSGTYGTLGTAAPANIPGARETVAAWTDAAGNAWIFGGFGLDSAGTHGDLNDLWKYSGGEWTWMGGSNTVDDVGIYGTQGTAAPSNVPGARESAAVWIDAAGDIWLFGGKGLDGFGGGGVLSDLWEYSAAEWTWVGGPNTVNQLGTYGTLGTAAPANVPGARARSTAWIDAAGNLWLFGGYGEDATNVLSGELGDLWKYQR